MVLSMIFCYVLFNGIQGILLFKKIK
jgi:hypothetical protein